MIEAEVYNGRDNPVELELQSDGAAISHTAITRVLLIAGVTTLDSNTAPGLFDFDQADRLNLKLGSAGLTAGRHAARLVIYDAAHTNGQVWGDGLVLIVKD